MRANLFIQGLRQHLGLQEAMQAEFLPVIIPTIDLRGFVLGNRSRVVWIEGSLSVLGASFGSITFTPGVDEIWQVHAYGVWFDDGTTSSYCMMGIRPNGTALPAGACYPLDNGIISVLGNSQARGAWFPAPLVLAGNDQLLARIRNVNAGAVTAYAAVLREIITTA